MRPSLLPLVLVAALVSPVLADELGQGFSGLKMKKSDGPSAVVPGCGSDAHPCRCEGPRGRQKFLHFILYEQNYVVGSNFTNDIESAASIAFRRHNVELIKPHENDQGTGGHQLISYPKEADCERRSEKDKKEKPLCVIPVEDQTAFCQIVRDAFKAHAPPAGYFPLFYIWFGGSLKLQIGTDVAGQFYPKGAFKSRCAVTGDDADVPDTAFAVIDVKPEAEAKQVLAHEIGHALGDSVGHKAWFEDQYPGENAPKDSKNIMLSRKSIGNALDLEMSPFQVQALCQSPYTSDAP